MRLPLPTLPGISLTVHLKRKDYATQEDIIATSIRTNKQYQEIRAIYLKHFNVALKEIQDYCIKLE